MSSETTTADSVSLDPVDVSISLHGIVCEMMNESCLRRDFDKNGAPWSQCVQSSHNTIEYMIGSGDIPESVCDCETFEDGELTCFMCYKHGIEEVA